MHAAAFAKQFRCPLVVLRVDPAADGEIGERAAAATEIDEFIRATLPAPVRGAVTSDIVLRGGVPASSILDVAAQRSAQLIVMGTHGRGTLARAFLGSTASTVLRDTSVPTAVVPPKRAGHGALDEATATFRFGTIVVPVDLHADVTQQLAWARRLASASARSLFVLHIVPPGGARGAEIDRVRAAAAGLLGDTTFTAVVREGRVVPEVIAAVHQEHADLVIMGRSSDAPGAMAYDVLRRTEAIVLMAP